MTSKYSINLLQAELLPVQPMVTLKRMLLVLALCALLMFAWVSYTQYQGENLAAQVSELKAQERAQKVKLAELELLINERKTDPVLVEKLDTLKLVMRNKRALHAKLTDPNRTYVAGFADSMTELANYYHSGIRLRNITIRHDDIIFSGLAKTPDAVPQWLAGFERSHLLSGKEFKHFRLTQNEQKLTEFTIGSSLSAASAADVKVGDE